MRYYFLEDPSDRIIRIIACNVKPFECITFWKPFCLDLESFISLFEDFDYLL